MITSVRKVPASTAACTTTDPAVATVPTTTAAGALFAMAVGVSRVVLGVHWVSDVLGGWLLSLAWVLPMTAVFQVWHPEAHLKSLTRSDASLTSLAPRPTAVGRGSVVVLVDDGVPAAAGDQRPVDRDGHGEGHRQGEGE